MVGYADQIIGVLEPKVGRAMAISVVKMMCKKQGLDISNITKDQRDTLADYLMDPLNVFGGIEFARDLVNSIKNLPE